MSSSVKQKIFAAYLKRFSKQHQFFHFTNHRHFKTKNYGLTQYRDQEHKQQNSTVWILFVPESQLLIAQGIE